MNERARNAQLVKKGLKDWRMNSGWPNESVNQWMNESTQTTDRLLDGQADESIDKLILFRLGFWSCGTNCMFGLVFWSGTNETWKQSFSTWKFFNDFALTAKMLRARCTFQCLSSMKPDKHLCRMRHIYIYILAPQDHDKHSLTTTIIWNSHHLLKFIFPFVRPWRPAIGWKVLNVRRVGHFGPFWGRCSGAAKWFFHVVRLGNVVKTRGPFGFRVFLRCFSWAVTGGVAHWW